MQILFWLTYGSPSFPNVGYYRWPLTGGKKFCGYGDGTVQRLEGV